MCYCLNRSGGESGTRISIIHKKYFKYLRLKANSIFEAFLTFPCPSRRQVNFYFYFMLDFVLRLFKSHRRCFIEGGSQSSLIHCLFFQRNKKAFPKTTIFLILRFIPHRLDYDFSPFAWVRGRTRLKIINLLRSIEKHICSFFTLLSNLLLVLFRLFHVHVCFSSSSHPQR